MPSWMPCAPSSASVRPRAPRAPCLLGGDAGVGKTRLLTELRDLAVDDGWQVAAGHCLDLADSGLPYLPFTEILGRLALSHPDLVEQVLDTHPALGRLQPGRRIRHAEGGADDQSLERGDLFDAVHALLERAADAGPLLVVVEDAHWADQSTRDMLGFLFGRPFATRVALVVSYRSDDLHRRHPLRRQVGEWARLPGVERMQLEPLPAGDVRSLVHRLHPDPMREPEIADIVTRAEGNAFFVEELVGAMSASGGSVPGDLADVLLNRLDRLDDEARAGGADRLRGRPPRLPPPARRGLRPRPGGARDGAAHRRRGQRAGALGPRLLRLPARPARRGGLRRPAARRAGPPARDVRRGAAHRPRSRRRRRAGPARAARPGPPDRPAGRDRGRQRRHARRRPRGGRPAVPAGAHPDHRPRGRLARRHRRGAAGHPHLRRAHRRRPPRQGRGRRPRAARPAASRRSRRRPRPAARGARRAP